MSARSWIAPAPAALAPAPRRAAGAGVGALLPAHVARAIGFAALALFATLHWAAMVGPSAPDRAALAVAAALAMAAALSAAGRVRGLLGRATVVLVAAAGLLACLVAVGLPVALLWPTRWGDLASGIAQGADGLARARVPYGGADPWTRLDMLLGGGALVAIAAAATFWPGRAGRWGHRTLAVLALGTLFALPVIEIDFSTQYLRGGAFAALLMLFLWLERLPRPDAASAAAVVAGVLTVALLAAPAVDRGSPWLDYNQWALSLSNATAERFDWSHRYGPLNWPRDGEEVLRVAARDATYWKTENLGDFDGVRWRRDQVPTFGEADRQTERYAAQHPAWVQKARFVVRGMQSSDYVGAGTTLEISDDAHRQASGGSFGTYLATGGLRRGDAYLARFYVPRPSASQLAAAPAAVDSGLDSYRTIALADYQAPTSGADPPDAVVVFPGFGTAPGVLVQRAGFVDRGGDRYMRGSAYARAYLLARRLAARSSTPYGYVKRVEAYLSRGFRYSEDVPFHSLPLMSFLFDDRQGYCQQFSGAMALLLRMGGVPARVATGFAPGSLDKRRREYVVRDLDAHSWVEAWFPGYGWVPFDPTPTTAPPRSQADTRTPSAARGDLRDAGTGLNPAPKPAQSSPGTLSIWTVLLGLAGLAALGGLAAAALAANRPHPDDPDDPLLAELERALRRSGRRPAPAVTLSQLERRFRDEPGACDYIRSLVRARFGEQGAGPSAAERQALRVALAEGLGWGGRLRAWWALPPRRAARS